MVGINLISFTPILIRSLIIFSKSLKLYLLTLVITTVSFIEVVNKLFKAFIAPLKDPLLLIKSFIFSFDPSKLILILETPLLYNLLAIFPSINIPLLNKVIFPFLLLVYLIKSKILLWSSGSPPPKVIHTIFLDKKYDKILKISWSLNSFAILTPESLKQCLQLRLHWLVIFNWIKLG